MKVKFAAVMLGCMLSSHAYAARPTQDHDLQCLAAIPDLAKSSDPKSVYSTLIASAFYFGRLDQMGLSPEQIQTRVEAIALSSARQSQDAGFADACVKDVNVVVKAMNRQGAKDWDAHQKR